MSVTGPDHFVEAFDAAVQMIGPVVLRQLVGLSVEFELPVGNAVAITPDQGTEVRTVVGQITLKIVIAENHVRKMAGSIWHGEGHHDAAVSHDARFGALRIAQGVNIHRLTVRCFAERSLTNRIG